MVSNGHSSGNEAFELQPIRTTVETETVASVEESPVYPSGTRLVFIVAGLLLSMFLGALDSTILAQAIPSITESFPGLSNIAWYSTAYSISNTAFKMVWGTAYRDFPIKPMFLTSMAIFEAGNVICATASSATAVIVGRVVAGLGGSGLMCGAFVIAALCVPKRYRPRMMGLTSLAFGVSSVAGPVLGGALVDALGWRWCFWINLPLGALAAVIMTVFYHQPPRSRTSQDTLWQKVLNMDVNGAMLVGGSLVCYVLAMHWLGSLSPHSPPVIGSLVGCVLLALSYAANEWVMGPRAMFQPRLLKNRNILANCTFAFFFSGVLFPLEYILPIQFQSLGGETAAGSGVRMIPLLLTVSVFTLLANGIISLRPSFSPLFVFGAMAGTAGTLFMYNLDGRGATDHWIGAEILTSVGVGLALQLPIMANVACVSAEDISVATSLALFFENVGTTLFVAASEAAFTSGLVESISGATLTIDLQKVIQTGATNLRSTFSVTQLPHVLAAYQEGCKQSYLVPVSCGSAAALIALVSAMPMARKSRQS